MTGGSAEAGTGGALLGRSEELAELRAGLDDSLNGRGRLFLLVGEAGIGKTRLLEALIQQTERTEVRAVRARCSGGTAGAPFGPWAQVLEACMAELPSDELARHLGAGAPDVARLVPSLAQRLPGIVPAETSEWPDARVRLFDAVVDFLRSVGAEGGLIVGLDDIHAADQDSLRLLQHMVGRPGPAKVLLVVTYRDADVRSSPHLQRLVASIARQGRRLVLSGLGEGDVATLLEKTMGRQPKSDVVRDLHYVTDGSPLFVEEAARLLAAEAALADMPVPEEVHDAVRRRLERVPEPVRDVLSVAAVVGVEFDLAVVQAASEVASGPLMEALTEAVAVDAVAEVDGSRWSFTHEVVRETLYDELRVSQRVALHRRVGDAVELTQADDLDPHVTDLAHHFFEAARGGDGTKARQYCSLAGDAAMVSLAFEDAAIQYGRALEALALAVPVDERERYRLLMSLARAWLRLDDQTQAREFQSRALKSARALGSAVLLGEAAVAFFGEPGWTIDNTQASVLAEARAALPPDDDPLLAKVLVASGAAAGNPETAVGLSDQGLAMARRLADADSLRTVLWLWRHANADRDVLDERLAVTDELLRLSTTAGNRERVLRARLWRVDDLFALGDMAGMSDELAHAAREAEQLRLPSLMARTTLSGGGLALVEGRIEDAERLALQAQARADQAGLSGLGDDVSCLLYLVRREQGRTEETADIARRKVGDPSNQASTFDRSLLGLALAELGKADEAREEIAGVAADVLHGRTGGRLAEVAVLADTAWTIGEIEWAEATYEGLLPWADRHVVLAVGPISLGASDRYLGQLATLLGRFDEADAHFEAAHRLHERLGAPGWLAHGQVDHARMLASRSGAGDEARARDLLTAARAAYATLGMPAHEERASALIDAPTEPAADAEAQSGVFALQGEYWAIDYAGVQARVRDSKGLRYLARLLRVPGQELHALDLVVGESGRTGPSPGVARQSGLDAMGAGDAGAVLDAKAKAAYKRRISELQEELEEASAHHDVGRLDRAQQEMDFLMAELAAAVGLGGRDRKAASDAERARQSVTRAIKGAIERISAVHPALGDHLRTTVRTGIYSSYSPDPRIPIRWDSG